MYRQIKEIKIDNHADLFGWLGVSNNKIYTVEKMWDTPEGERYVNVINDNNKIVSVPELFYKINF